MDDHTEIKALLKEIQANQLSLHDDMTTVIERLTKLEATVTELVEHSGEPTAIDEHQLYTAARSLVVETGKASTSLLQRVLRIGYSRAAALMDTLEGNGVISANDGSRPRTVLLDPDALSEIEDSEENSPVLTGDTDELYDDAVLAVREAGKSSVSYLQRKLRIGYSRAAFLQSLLEKNGVIAPQDGLKPREVLKS